MTLDSAASVQNLTDPEATESKYYDKHWVEELCVICLEEWKLDDNVVVLPCLHRLHKECAH